MLFALKGQLTVVEYPDGYYEFKSWFYDNHRYVQRDTWTGTQAQQYDVMVLPWHQYMKLSFANRIVPNPRDHFFQVSDTARTTWLVGDNMEL
jgi:hypothetical protein